MALRHIVFAAFMAGACAAHADVITSGSSGTSAQSAFLSGWTTSNGASVLGSGALSGNLSLIGGVAYGSSADQAGSLLNQASSTLGANGQTKLFYSKGIEGMYLLGAGHGILAAMLGTSVSVVGSNGGVIVGTGSVADVGSANVVSASAKGGAIDTNVNTGGAVGGDSGTGLQVVQPLASAVPEPSTAALMLIGMIGAGALTRRRAR
jgi:hypothetical protein